MHTRYGISEHAYLAALAAFHAAVARAPGQVAFANLCRCTQGNVSQLVKKGSLLPARYVAKVSDAYDIPRGDLRPDLFPTEQSASPSDDSHRSVALGGAIDPFDRAATLNTRDAA